MRKPIVTLIHATPAAIAPVVDSLGAIRPVRLLNQLDEALLSEIDRHGGLTAECVARMATQLELAQLAGSSVILTTCNAYSLTIISKLRPAMPDVPIVVIDEPMIRRALAHGRFAVIGTVRAGLESQREIVEALSREDSIRADLKVEYVLREDAFAALAGGNPEEHDRIVVEEVERALRSFDLVVLAQASMARVLSALPSEMRAHVLASPAAAADEVDRILGTLKATKKGGPR